MNTRIVTCKLCLEDVDINTVWCVIDKKKRHYECKDVGLCYELSACKFKPHPSAPPVDLEYDNKLIEEIEQLITIKRGSQHYNDKSIISKIKHFFFPKTKTT